MSNRIFEVKIGLHGVFDTRQLDTSLTGTAAAHGVAAGVLPTDLAGTSTAAPSTTSHLATDNSLTGGNTVVFPSSTADLSTSRIVDRAPIVATIPDIVFFEGLPATFNLFLYAVDPDNDALTVSLNAVALNNHVSFNPTTGILSYDGGALAVSGVAETTTGHIATFDDGRSAVVDADQPRVFESNLSPTGKRIFAAAPDRSLAGTTAAFAQTTATLDTAKPLVGDAQAQGVADADLTVLKGAQPLAGSATATPVTPDAYLTGGSLPPIDLVGEAVIATPSAPDARFTTHPFIPSLDGLNFWSECARCAKRVRHKQLLADGQQEGLWVCLDCWDPKHPQEEPMDWAEETRDVQVYPQISIPPDNRTEAPTIAFDAQGNLIFV